MSTLEFRWGVSRGRDSYGYTICSLWVDGRKVASCNGGGYDMKGTCLGNFIAGRFADRLRALDPVKAKELYGLTYHDPDYDPGKAVVGKDCSNRTLGGPDGVTVAEAEAAGQSAGLERLQAFYSASSPVPTERHRIPLIDGACGFRSVETIAEAIGLSLEWIPTRSKKQDLYQLHDQREVEERKEVAS